MTPSSTALKPQYLVADAVERAGLLSVLTMALKSWWNRPRLPAELPPVLRADLGLPRCDVAHHYQDNAEIRFHYR